MAVSLKSNLLSSNLMMHTLYKFSNTARPDMLNPVKIGDEELEKLTMK